eukprot:Opistho-2@1411
MAPITFRTAVAVVLIAAASSVFAERRSIEYDPTKFGFPAKEGAKFTVYTDTDASGKPTVAGFRIPDFLNSPADLTVDMTKNVRADLVLPETPGLGYKILGVNWNFAGHRGGLTAEDRAIFNTLPAGQQQADFLTAHGAWVAPHFDFHSYTVDGAWLDQIKCSNGFPPCKMNDDDLKKFTTYPDARFMPTNYLPSIYLSTPRMGIHWDDVTDSVSKAKFNMTPGVLYGSYNGRVAFFETMIANPTFLNLQSTGDKLVQSLNRPDHFQRSGYYASQFSLQWDAMTSEYIYEIFGFDYFTVDPAFANDEWKETFGEWQKAFKAWKDDTACPTA